MTRARPFLFFLAISALAACFDTTMSLAGFDTTCAQDQDCAVVETGSVCGCDCGNAAINKKGLAAYQAEYQSKAAHCSGPGVGCDCATVTPVCTQGQCGFKVN